MVSVLKDIKGVGAMKRSTALMAGKRLAAFYLFAMYASSLVVLSGLLAVLAARPPEHVESVVGRTLLGVALLVLWTAATLVGIVVQSVFYLVCRAYHQESVDKLALAEKVDGFLEEYLPLKGSGGEVGGFDGEIDEV